MEIRGDSGSGDSGSGLAFCHGRISDGFMLSVPMNRRGVIFSRQSVLAMSDEKIAGDTDCWSH
jgi:hypothetical protein